MDERFSIGATQIVAYKSPLNSFYSKLFTISKSITMDTGTLIQVVAYLDAEIKSDREFLESESAEYLSFEEDYAISSTICRLERIIEHFQEIIDSQVSSMEVSQGM